MSARQGHICPGKNNVFTIKANDDAAEKTGICSPGTSSTMSFNESEDLTFGGATK